MKTWTYPSSKDRWDPVRSGRIYCSPACGYKCTWAAYQKAKKDAASLAKKCGKGWTGSVWENAGWCFSAKSPGGRLGMYVIGESTGASYRVFVSEVSADGIGGRWVAEGKTPTKALDDARRIVQDYLMELVPTLNDLRLNLDIHSL